MLSRICLKKWNEYDDDDVCVMNEEENNQPRYGKARTALQNGVFIQGADLVSK